MSLWMNGLTKEDCKRCLPFVIGIIAFLYFAVMAVKTYAGVFVSTDSADFLAASTVWMVPQTYGYPLYIVLGHFLNLFPGELPAKMTVLLSALPAAIAVFFVYKITFKLTGKVIIATICSVVLLGTVVFLTEATVTKGYALTAMFLTIGYWFYINDRKYLTVIFLGLATAVHMMVVVIVFLWLIADRRWRLWLGKPLLVYIAVGIGPYSLIPILMALDTPRYLAGSFSLANLKGYWSGTGRSIIGMLSVMDAPSRWWFLGRVLLASSGLAIIPLLNRHIYNLRNRQIAVLIAAPVFILWYVATCLDVQVWTYLSVGAPFVAVLVGLGLARMKEYHKYAIAASAIVLVIVNGFFMNADAITRQDPRMEQYKASLEALPDGAVVVTVPSSTSLGLFYTIVEGKNLVPLIYSYLELDSTMGMDGYEQYLADKYGVWWRSTLEGVQNCLDNNRPVYYVPIENSWLNPCFTLEGDIQYDMPNRIIALTGVQPQDKIEVTRNE